MDEDRPMPRIGTNSTNESEVTTRTVRAITNELVGALLNYLQSHPYKDVNGLINSLSSSPSINVTISNNGTPVG
jgi:hypothetical protein